MFLRILIILLVGHVQEQGGVMIYARWLIVAECKKPKVKLRGALLERSILEILGIDVENIRFLALIYVFVN